MSPIRAETPRAIGWDWPPVRFELRSNDPDLLQRGRMLFRSAPEVTPPGPPVPHRLLEYSCIRPHENGGPPTRRPWRVGLPGTPRFIEADTVGRALWEIEIHALQAFLQCPRTLPGIHAALLSRDGRGIAVAGPYESGKSTLACALWRSGWSLHCDDAVLLDSERRMARPTPRRVSLRHTSRSLFDDELWARLLATPSCVETSKGIMFHPREIDARSEPRSVPLDAIVFLARHGTRMGPAELRRMPPAHALMALLPYSNGRERFGTAAAIRHLQPISAGVGAYDLGRGPIPAMVRRIEELMDGALTADGA